MNLPNFWYGSCSYGVLWKNHTLYAGKILVWRNFGHFKAKIWTFCAKIAIFVCFWSVIFIMLLWILLIFGMEVVLMIFFFSFPTLFMFWAFPGNQSYFVLLIISSDNLAKFQTWKTSKSPEIAQNVNGLFLLIIS